MYKVKATRNGGAMTFAAGTAEQAVDKVLELLGQGLKDVRVVSPAGAEMAAEDFKRKFFGEGG